jgi:hypothetical protein
MNQLVSLRLPLLWIRRFRFFRGVAAVAGVAVGRTEANDIAVGRLGRRCSPAAAAPFCISQCQSWYAHGIPASSSPPPPHPVDIRLAARCFPLDSRLPGVLGRRVVWRVARPGDRGNVFLGLGLGPVHSVPEVGVMAKRPQPQGLLNAGRGLGTLSA